MKDGYSIYLAPISELQRILDSMEKELALVETGNNQELFEQLDLLEQERIRINESIIRQVKKSCLEGKEKLIDACMSGGSQEMIDETATIVAKNIITAVDSDYKQQIKKLSNIVNENLEKYGIEMSETGKINIKGAEFDFGKIIYDGAQDLGQTDTLKSAVGGALLGEMVGIAAGEIVAAGTGTLATALAGAPLGPIGIIGGAVIGLLIGGKMTRDKQAAQESQIQQKIAEENRKRQAAIDAYYKKLQVEIGTKMDAVENDYSQKATEMITLAISNLKETINLKIADGVKLNEKVSEAREKISFLKAELEGIKSTMK